MAPWKLKTLPLSVLGNEATEFRLSERGRVTHHFSPKKRIRALPKRIFNGGFLGPRKLPKNASQKNHTPMTHPLRTTSPHLTAPDPSINLSRELGFNFSIEVFVSLKF